jgi:hypothetical protein
MREMIRRTFDSIESWLIRRELYRAMLKYHYTERQSPLDRNNVSIDAFLALEAAAARKLGVQPKQTDLERIFETKFGISKDAFSSFGSSELHMPISADLALDEWIKNDEGLSVHLLDTFDEQGNRCKSFTMVIDGRAIQREFSLIVSYKSAIHYICFRRYEETRNEWKWGIDARGPRASSLLAEFSCVYEAFMIAQLRGKAITRTKEVIELKEYQRDELVYPPELGRSIDQLIRSFRQWANPASKVCRWGSLLIGRPGTGKTTIGGMLGAMRPANCTFVYFPAADVRAAWQITNAFALAKQMEPCVLQIDDVDLIARDRRKGGNVEFTSALMEALDGLQEGSAKLFVIMTSNDVSKMEPAIVDRAGRISNKITFTGFGDACGDMLSLHARTFGLSISRSDIDSVALALKEHLQEFTPDEAKNVCQRLYLLHDQAPISTEALTAAILETAKTFHSSTANESFLPTRKLNGDRQSLSHHRRHQPGD